MAFRVGEANAFRLDRSAYPCKPKACDLPGLLHAIAGPCDDTALNTFDASVSSINAALCPMDGPANLASARCLAADW